MNNIDFFKAANIFYNHRINKTRLNKLPNNFQPKNTYEAYMVQDELKKIYLSIKDNYLIGKKVGCTNKIAREQINIYEPFYGNIFSKFSTNNYCKLLSKNFSIPFLEPEISFIVKKDIDVSRAPYKFEELEELIDSVIASTEIIDFRYDIDLKDIGINNLISNNGASEFWIRGSKELKLYELDLSNHIVKVYINDQFIEKGNSSNVLGNPLNSFLWLINNLCLKGETLLKNNIVSTGTCTKAISLKKDSRVKIDFGLLGIIDFQYI